MSKVEKSDQSLHEQITDPNKSAFSRYRELVLGSSSIWYLIKYELIVLTCSHIPGALGLLLRKYFYPRILNHVGSNVVFGQGVNIVHGVKVSIGSNVVIGDRVVLDAKGVSNEGIKIGDNTTISRNAILSCKNGDIYVGEGCSIGINTLVHAVKGSNVHLGNEVLVGAFSYFVGGGTYGTEDLDVSFKKQEAISLGGIEVENNVWIGGYAQIFDGVSIGTGSVIGASTIVNKNVDEYEVVAGVPMKSIRSRKKEQPAK